jgi:hypothetical protein
VLCCPPLTQPAFTTHCPRHPGWVGGWLSCSSSLLVEISHPSQSSGPAALKSSTCTDHRVLRGQPGLLRRKLGHITCQSCVAQAQGSVRTQVLTKTPWPGSWSCFALEETEALLKVEQLPWGWAEMHPRLGKGSTYSYVSFLDSL